MDFQRKGQSFGGGETAPGHVVMAEQGKTYAVRPIETAVVGFVVFAAFFFLLPSQENFRIPAVLRQLLPESNLVSTYLAVSVLLGLIYGASLALLHGGVLRLAPRVRRSAGWVFGWIALTGGFLFPFVTLFSPPS